MSKNLFDIASEYLNIIEELEENGGEVTESIENRLNINQNEMEEKLEAYRYVKASMEGEIQTLQDEIDRLQSKINTKNRVIEVLKDRLLYAVRLYGSPTKTGSISYATPKSKFTLVHTKPIVIDEDTDISLTNTTLLPYMKTNFNIVMPGTVAEALLPRLNSLFAELNDRSDVKVKTELDLSKTLLKQAIKEGTTFEKIRIDEEAAYIKIT